MKSGQVLRVDEYSSLPEGALKNCMVHSRVRTYDKCNTVSSSISLKLVHSGVERYRVNKIDYKLVGNEFFIVDEGQHLDIAFKEEQLAEGVCFYLDKDLYRQAISLLENGDFNIPDDPEKVADQELLSLKYRQSDSNFGGYLFSVSDMIRDNKIDLLNEEFFVDLSWKLARYHQEVTGTVNRISAVKSTTKVELFKRAMLSRDFIEDNLFSEKITINQLALESALSEVQLHRVFKKVFGTTPYQYVLKRKMEKAAALIEQGNISISEISRLLGFSDLAAFSKLFKKTYGTSPSRFQELN